MLNTTLVILYDMFKEITSNIRQLKHRTIYKIRNQNEFNMTLAYLLLLFLVSYVVLYLANVMGTSNLLVTSCHLDLEKSARIFRLWLHKDRSIKNIRITKNISIVQ